MCDLKKVLMERDGMSSPDADMAISSLRYRASCGESAEVMLNDEYSLEPDYIFDII